MAGVMVGHAALTGLTVYGHLWVMLAIGLMIPSLMKRTAEHAETTGHSNSNLEALVGFFDSIFTFSSFPYTSIKNEAYPSTIGFSSIFSHMVTIYYLKTLPP